jgi:hypothetical protein
LSAVFRKKEGLPPSHYRALHQPQQVAVKLRKSSAQLLMDKDGATK